MSNPNDPKQPTPDQPDPNAPPPAADAPANKYQGGASSFEFQLPDEVGSYSDLPPIPEPDEGSGTLAALPPKPDARRPDGGTSFDFGAGSGSRGSFGDFGMGPQPLPPVEGPPLPTPTDDSLVLTDLPAMPGPGDSAILFEPPLPTVEPASAVLHIEPLEPTTGLDDVADFLPDVPAPTDDALADIDLATASGVNLSEAPKVTAGDSSVGFGSPLPVPDEELPLADPVSSIILGSGKAASDAGSAPDLAAFLPLPAPAAPAGDSAISLDAVEATAAPSSVTLGADHVPVAEPASAFSFGADKVDSSGSVPDVNSLFPAAPVAGATDASAEPSPVAPHGTSSFEFQLPDGVDSVSDLPPIPEPDAGDSGTLAALPPKPVARPVGSASFDFIDVSGRPFAGIGPDGQSLPAREAGEPADVLPVAEAAPDSKVALGHPEPVDPVSPVSGWLDSAVTATPVEPVPVADVFDAPVADLVESSDIFAGGPVPAAERVDNSDLIEVSTGFALPTGRVESGRPSEIALTFNDPPGGSTLNSGVSDDLPVADEVGNSSSTLLGSPGRDDESIHDAPEVASADPLFDSANLGDAPDLPAAPRKSADAADYGAAPGYTSDASSILGDLGGPHDRSDADSSSVRVEAPGVDRTLTGGPSDGAFDLTVADEPVPDGLFDEPIEVTEWASLSGSDLVAEGNTAAEIDLDDVVEVADADLADDATDAPSNIFTAPPSGPASARIGGPARTGDEPTGDLTDDRADAVEFTDYPDLGATVERAALPSPSDAPAGKRLPNLSSADFELPAGYPATPARAAEESEDDGAVDWDDAALADDDEATRGVPRDASLSGIIRGELPDDSDEVSTKSTRPVVPLLDDGEDEPVVTVDWMAGSAEGSAVAEPVDTFPVEPAEKKGKDKARTPRDAGADEPTEKKTKPTKPGRLADTGSGTATTERSTKPERKGGRGGILAGLLVGGLVTSGAFAGAYFGGVIPNAEKVAVKPPDGPQPGNTTTPPVTGTPPAAVDPQIAFAVGETAKAVEHFKTTPPTTTAEKASAGHIRVFAKVQSLKDGAPVAADDADLKAARDDLQAVIKDEAGRAEPGGVRRAVKAAVALGVSHEIAGDAKAARDVYIDAMGKFPEYASTFEALIDKLNALDPTTVPGTSRRLDPIDAERLLFAVTLLRQDAPKGEDPEPGVYYWKAVTLAGANKYKEAVEQIEKAKAAHVARAKTVAGRGLNPLSDPLEQIFTRSCDDLKAYWTLRGAVYGNPGVAAAIKRDGGVSQALDALLKAEKGLTTAQETVKKLEAETVKLDKEAKASDKARLEAEDKVKTAALDLKAAEKKLDTAAADLKAAEADAKSQRDALAAVAEALKPAAPLPEKYSPADLIAATKSVASRATGPDLKNLVPNAMIAIGGGGLATGQFLDIAERLTKAEAGAKDATAKLAAETKRLNDKYDADTKTLKEDHAVAVKELKVASAADLKKLSDKFAVESKKLTDEYAVASAKLKEANEAALADEQARTAAEKKKFLTREIEFQKQLANAVTPGQVMDIWLPTLTDLRRPSDAAPALASAEKALAGSAADSEDAAKARTVAGMAYLLRGEFARAKELFQAARRSPAYKDAAGKPWAVAADRGLEAIDDPVAPYRQPVVIPPIDLKAAAQALDAGIWAYKEGRYDAAVKALLDATKNNPAAPVAWYFLGAARWAKGDEDQAKKDFAQGAEREKVSVVPGRTTSAALTPIQGTTRDAIDRTRP